MIAILGFIQILHGVRSAAGRVGVYYQVSTCIVTAWVTNCSNKALGIVVYSLVAISLVLWLVPGVVVVEHLVVTLKQQVLVVVLEGLSNLLPQLLELCLVLVIVGAAGMNPVCVAIASVVVYVKYAVHSVVDNVVNHLFYAIHPRLVNIAIAVHLLIPCHWYTDRVETSLFHHLHQFRFGYRLSPASLVLLCSGPSLACIVSIERVTQIPTYAHVLYSVFCVFKALCLCWKTHQQTAC